MWKLILFLILLTSWTSVQTYACSINPIPDGYNQMVDANQKSFLKLDYYDPLTCTYRKNYLSLPILIPTLLVIIIGYLLYRRFEKAGKTLI